MDETNAGTQRQADENAASVVGPPLPQRRPRVRTVSSRFMSPVISSSSFSSGDLNPLTANSPIRKHAIPNQTPGEFQAAQLPRSMSVQRRRHDQEPLSHALENIPDTIRSLDTPLRSHVYNNKALISVQRKNRAVVKLFKENGGAKTDQQQQLDITQSKSLVHGKATGRSGITTPLKPDTPTVNGTSDRIIPSRYRLTTTPNLHRATNSDGSVTAAEQLLQSSGISLSGKPTNLQLNPVSSCNTSGHFDDDKLTEQNYSKITSLNGSDSKPAIVQRSKCPNSPVSTQSNKADSQSDLRSSMPEIDKLPESSIKLLAKTRGSFGDVGTESDTSKLYNSPCFRSLNLPLSSSEQYSFLNSLKTEDKAASVYPKSTTNSTKMGNLPLPLPPTCIKLGADARKGRKVVNHQEDVHSLKLLYNKYLQWRYANAKAQSSIQSQSRETEKKLYSLGIKISDLRDTVTRKRSEMGLLQRTKTLSAILEAEMPHLDKWSALEEEFSTSLLEAINALLTCSVQLPVGGNIRVDVRETEEALNSAVRVMEMICFQVQSLLPKAAETDTLISELARAISGERALIEECGDLLSKTYTTQVEECSLRGHLIQIPCKPIIVGGSIE